MTQLVKIQSIDFVTDDVLRLIIDKPIDLEFIPGQAANISIHKGGWNDVVRTYAITSTPSDDFLEFYIKIYAENIGGGFLQTLAALVPQDEIWVHNIVGTVTYKGEGVFIAGGVGITPFISMLRKLERDHAVGDNKLIYASRKKEDILFEEPLHELLGDNFVRVLSDEKIEGYGHGFLTQEIIASQLLEKTQYFYLCGPRPMTDSVEEYLKKLGVPAELIVIERF